MLCNIGSTFGTNVPLWRWQIWCHLWIIYMYVSMTAFHFAVNMSCCQLSVLQPPCVFCSLCLSVSKEVWPSPGLPRRVWLEQLRQSAIRGLPYINLCLPDIHRQIVPSSERWRCIQTIWTLYYRKYVMFLRAMFVFHLGNWKSGLIVARIWLVS